MTATLDQHGAAVQRDVATSGTAYQAPHFRWQRRYSQWLAVIDAVCIVGAGLIANAARFGLDARDSLHGVSYLGITFLTVPIWLGLLALSRAYEERFLGTGSEEYRRVAQASVRFIAGVALVSFLLNLPFSRIYVGVTLVVGTTLLLGGRYAGRRALSRLRARGRCMHRVVLAGERQQLLDLYAQLQRTPGAGFEVIGACTPSGQEDLIDADGLPTLPVLGSLRVITQAAQAVNADTVALASSPMVRANIVRRVAWELEGSGVDLVVSPGLVDVAGPRIHIRPVAGLPLLHVEEPEFGGGRRLLKTAFDVFGATLVLGLLSPLLFATAVLVGTTSRGGVFFRQVRVGRDGREFQAWKFRTMVAGAERMLVDLTEANEVDGALFKIREDPRVTRVGAWLRRWSLDELPQLFNVLTGEMSLVGPRPPLPHEAEQYHSDVQRRLLVKPGLTGLWQVSGRSDLSWEDTVRLDLYYVENWSLALDAQILGRTLWAVARGKGAY
jgi:exopolysaccharide biosynthesis polyprenyl glycosylphosphotransferase